VIKEFAIFVVGLNDYSNISSLDETSTISAVRRWICHGANGVHLQTLAIRILSQVASLSSAKRNWSTHGFIHSVKHNRLCSQKSKDLVYVHSNLHRRATDKNNWAMPRKDSGNTKRTQATVEGCGQLWARVWATGSESRAKIRAAKIFVE
jgi:hypothetical protein